MKKFSVRETKKIIRIFQAFVILFFPIDNIMDIEDIINNSTNIFKDFDKDNTVQEILKESVDAPINTNTSELVLLKNPTQHFLNISELTDNLILCSASALNLNILDSFNIKCIVNAAPELPDTPLHSNTNIIYHKINILDNGSSRILPYFDEVADLINETTNFGGRTLVYCVAGVSRSASLCIAYFMKHHHLSLLEAYNYIKLRRPKIKPNCEFFKQLIEYEKFLFGCNSVYMIFNEFVRMEIPDVYDCEYKFINQFNKKRRNSNGRY